MKLSATAKKWVCAAAVFVGCLAVFFALWFAGLYKGEDKGSGEVLNDAAEVLATPGIYSGDELRQRFYCEQGFYALGVRPWYEGEPPVVGLRLQVFSDDGTLLASADGDAHGTRPGEYAFFEFGTEIKSGNGWYELVFATGLRQQGHTYALQQTLAPVEGWTLQINGADEAGALCLVAVTEKVGGFLPAFYLIFAVVVAGALAGLLLLLWGRQWPLHRYYAVAAASLGLLFCLILPPYSSPDEVFHINQTFEISSGWMGQRPQDGQGFVRRSSDHNEVIENRFTNLFTYKELARTAFGQPVDDTPVADSRAVVGGYRALYWPAALVVTLCRLLGLGFVPLLFLGRLVNLALFVLLTTWAVKLAPAGKMIFAGVGLLPMTLHLAASFSRDCLTIGLYMLYIALCLNYALDKETITGRDILLLAGVAVVVAPAKAAYLLLVLFGLIIPSGRFCLRGKALPGKAALAVKLGIMALAIGVALVVNSGFVRMATASLPGSALYEVEAVAQPAAQQEQTVDIPEAALPSDGDLFGLGDFLRSPGVMLRLVLNTLGQQFTFWWQTMLGGNLSYFSLQLDWGFVLVLTVLMCLTVLAEPDEKLPGTRQRLWGGLLVLGTAGLVVLGCVLWTPRHYTSIYGIQGRYFLPMLPLALYCVYGLFGGVKKTRPMTKPLLYGFFTTGCFSLLNAFWLIAMR